MNTPAEIGNNMKEQPMVSIFSVWQRIFYKESIRYEADRSLK